MVTVGRKKIVKIRFDMANEHDVATYQRLAESAQRADRRGRGNQANYLVSLMLGVRTYSGLRLAGLTERPQFPPGLDEVMNNLSARVQELSRRIEDMSVPRQDRAPVLRLVPTNGEDPQ
ncbi:MAG: hypothetical protein A4E19_05975 [Nitrospira sp. SG-bin1]|nr:MAG: hypothetical protein A4E19_05975 [Nitrospira sp. SG-bin1]